MANLFKWLSGQHENSATYPYIVPLKGNKTVIMFLTHTCI